MIMSLIEELQPFPYEQYKGIVLDPLVIYAINEIAERGIDPSFENIVAASYLLFPRKFSLQGYPTFPDALRVDHVLRRSIYKTRRWLRGKSKQGFTLTDVGYKILREVKEALSVAPKSSKEYSHTRRYDRLLAEVRRSSAFVKYQQGDQESITASDCCYALQCTLDSDSHIRITNLRQLRTIAADLEQNDIIIFLDWLGDRFDHIIKGYAR